MSAIGIMTLIGVALQLVATLLFQFPPLAGRAMRLDTLGVIPRWKFFSNALGEIDYEVELCPVRADGGEDGWRVVWQSPARRWRDAVWNPDGYRWGAQWCAVAMLEKRMTAGKGGDADGSLAYRRVLRLARAQVPPDAAGFRFALVRCAGGARDRVFTSPVHPL